MATVYATHGAAAVKQIDSLPVTGTWATNDYATFTINGKDLVVTIGADTSTTQVAEAIRDAWNAPQRLDSENGSTDATSNFGGQEFGEFSEAEASIDPDAASTVLITARRAGIPFTLSVTVSTAGDGDISESTTQAATGPWHWSDGDNWSGGSAPANDDIVVLKDQSGPNVGFKYGLPNASKEVTIQHWMSYTGPIGLPPVNNDNPGKPYPEYRQRYVRLDDAGTGTNIAHRFGIGTDGTGSPLINLKHTTVKASPVVYNTGTPQISGIKALNICCTENTSTINVLNGSVDFSSQDSGTAAFATAYVNGGDARCINGMKSSGVVIVSGGKALIGCDQSITYTCRSGVTRIENQTATVTLISIFPGATVDYASSATITAINGWGGVFDARNDAGAFTITNVTLFNPVRFLDPYRRITFTNDMAVYYELSPDLLLGPSSLQPIKIGF